MKQTAVEYAVEWLTPFVSVQQKYIDELLKEAKEMEYERMLEFANWCRIYDKSHPNEVNMIQQLYTKFQNETYGGNND
jgi:hypothetical protein